MGTALWQYVLRNTPSVQSLRQSPVPASVPDPAPLCRVAFRFRAGGALCGEKAEAISVLQPSVPSVFQLSPVLQVSRKPGDQQQSCDPAPNPVSQAVRNLPVFRSAQASSKKAKSGKRLLFRSVSCRNAKRSCRALHLSRKRRGPAARQLPHL